MKSPTFVFALAAIVVFCITPSFAVVQIPSLAVMQNISVGRDCLLAAYNCAAGEKLLVQTNSVAAGAISIDPHSIIDGDVAVGAGGNPAQVIINPFTVTGAMYAQSQSLAYPSVMVPTNLAYSASKGNIAGTMTISNSGRYEGIDLASGAVLTINAPVSLYVTGNISLRNASQIQITSNGSLTLYAGGNVTGDGGLSFNTASQDTKKFQLLGLNTCTSISLLSNSTFYGQIYAPAADFSARNGNVIYGSCVSNSFFLDHNNSFYYAGSLPEPATIGILALGGMILRRRKH